MRAQCAAKAMPLCTIDVCDQILSWFLLLFVFFGCLCWDWCPLKCRSWISHLILNPMMMMMISQKKKSKKQQKSRSKRKKEREKKDKKEWYNKLKHSRIGHENGSGAPQSSVYKALSNVSFNILSYFVFILVFVLLVMLVFSCFCCPFGTWNANILSYFIDIFCF